MEWPEARETFWNLVRRRGILALANENESLYDLFVTNPRTVLILLIGVPSAVGLLRNVGTEDPGS